MMISTRGRYALRVLIDLAEHNTTDYIPLRDVADRQQISLKYIERIMPVLTKNGYVTALHGKGGGYRLEKSPDSCLVGDILRLTEGTLAPVSCLECSQPVCPMQQNCPTLPMWKKLDKMINSFFDSITLKDLMQKKIDG